VFKAAFNTATLKSFKVEQKEIVQEFLIPQSTCLYLVLGIETLHLKQHCWLAGFVLSFDLDFQILSNQLIKKN
jgi:hypothetical protein